MRGLQWSRATASYARRIEQASQGLEVFRGEQERSGSRECFHPPESLSVRHPYIFDLGCVMEKPATFGVGPVVPVIFPAIAGPDLLHVPDRRSTHHDRFFVAAEAPDRVDAVMLGESLP